MESGGGIGQIERDKKPLFRGECSGVINLVLREPIANFARAPEPLRLGTAAFRFISLSYRETPEQSRQDLGSAMDPRPSAPWILVGRSEPQLVG